MDTYDDIINLPHFVSSKRKQMPMENRAAQFAPFAALSGHGEAIDEATHQHISSLSPDRDIEKSYPKKK